MARTKKKQQSGPIEVVVWEAHISDLSRRDTQWSNIWTLFLKSCTVPEDVANFPGHASQEETRQGRKHREELAHCLGEPKPCRDAMLEWAAKTKGKMSIRRHAAPSSSTSSSSSSAPSPSSSIMFIPPRRKSKGGHSPSDWVLTKGKYRRRGLGEEEEHVRELLGTILGGSKIKSNGNFYYPPNGYQAWNKNAFASNGGWRLSFIHNIPTDRSHFSYRHPATGLVQTCTDCDGTLRLYRVGSLSQPFWHCSRSDGHCWSLCYQLPTAAAETIKQWLRPVTPLVPKPPPLNLSTLPLSISSALVVGLPCINSTKFNLNINSNRHSNFFLASAAAALIASTSSSPALLPPPPSPPKTPRAVTLLFGHRRHKANVKKTLKEKQALELHQLAEEEVEEDGTNTTGMSSASSSRRGSRRYSRNLSIEGGGEVDRDRGEGIKGGGSGIEDSEFMMNGTTAATSTWIRSGELGTGDDEWEDADDFDFDEILIEEAPAG